MRSYETIFIVRPDMPQDELEKVLEFYKDNITSNGGEIVKVEPWGKQSMAFEIENHREGYYFLIQYNADEKYNEELEKRYRYSEDVFRYIIVQLDEKKFKASPKKDATPRRGRKPRKEDAPRVEAAAETPVEVTAEAPAETADTEVSE